MYAIAIFNTTKLLNRLNLTQLSVDSNRADKKLLLTRS